MIVRPPPRFMADAQSWFSLSMRAVGESPLHVSKDLANWMFHDEASCTALRMLGSAMRWELRCSPSRFE